jgi:ribonuclease HI
VFDGGSKGNPGRAYGSYQITPWGSERASLGRMHFGRGTNNEAEYLSLLAALRALRAFLHGKGESPAVVRLEIRGDSQLVIRQLKGSWKAKDARMRELRDEANGLLRGFGKVQLIEQPREKTVKVLGH